jgi:hypothetical protein
MACSFSNLENSCGCLIGYSLPLLAADNTDITYPLHVLNVLGADLGEATTPSQAVSLWNSDTANQAVGILSLGTAAYCFTLSRIAGVIPPSKIVGTAETVTPPATFSFDYGKTALDTTGAPPNEAAYIASVNTVYTASGQIAGAPLATGSNVSVTNFGNTADAVLFMQIDATEAAFTKWSEVGNALQQNQPIDASFGTGTAVWFKSTRAGKTIYITRAQTSFAGAIIFSR